MRSLPAFTGLGAPASQAGLPLSLSTTEPAESMLVPLVNQFGLMQQQMFDQFQQAMAMMVQMFGTMHRDQMEVIREELERLNELSDEVHALRAELAGRTQAEPAAVSSEPGTVTPVAARAVPVEPTIAVRPAATETAPSPKAVAADATGGTEQPATARSMPQQPSTPISALSESAALARSLKTPANNDQGPTENSRPFGPEPSLKNNETKAASTSERDSVVWLHQRIMLLQQERETRWQKILKLLPGVS